MMNLGIRIRVLLLTLVPLLLFSLVVGKYMVLTRVQDIEQALYERGETVARYLARESEFGLFSENGRQLRQIATLALNEPDVEEITILNSAHEVIASAGIDHEALQRVAAVNGDQSLLIRFSAPVYRSGIDVTDIDEQYVDTSFDENTLRHQPIGWVEVGMSRRTTLIRQQSIIRDIVMMTTATALFSMLIALWLGRGIVRPVIRLSHAVDNMRKGALETRVDAASGGELGALEHGFNDMAEAMEQSRDRMQDEIREATGKLQQSIEALERNNRELELAREEALVAGNEKSKFLANMSHEIRTPINAILGYTSQLEKSGLSADQYEYARTIGCASNQLLRVIDDILSYSKLESGTIELDHSDFDLRDVLEDVLCMMGTDARDKQLELVLLIDADVPLKLNGDATRIRQVVINLLSNAIKFTENGGVNVQVRLIGRHDHQVEIEIQVIDSGIGMPAEVLDDIFASFHQADASISRRYGGTGLGLAIVSRLVALWGGRVGVSSEPGVGSTFWVTLKCALQPAQQESEIDPKLARCKILLYDDNPVARRAVCNLLLPWTSRIFMARHRNQIAEMLEASRDSSEPFDLVLLGVGPEQSGRDGVPDTEALVDLVRQQYALPVLLLLNNRRSSLLSRSLTDNRLMILVKPVRRDILYRKLCALLDIQTPAQEPGRVGADARRDEEIADYSGMRLLLAEDNEFNRDLVTRILEDAGIEVRQAVSGAEALELARVEDFDLVIMDLHLPGMDGAETARRLRRLRPALEHVPIIALTADVFFDDPEKLRAASIDACLLKPLDESRLWQTISAQCMHPATESNELIPPPVRSNADIRAMMQPRLVVSIRDLHRRISVAVAEGDFAGLNDLVHEMKGLVGYFKLQELADVVADLESALAGERPDGERINATIALFDRLVEQMAVSLPREGTGA